MKATTVKVDGNLLRSIEEMKPPQQSVTAFIRSVLQKEVDRRTLLQAAHEYRDFVKEHKDEGEWLDEWDRADLVSVPTTKEAVE